MRRRLQIVGEPRSRARSFASIEDAIVAIRAGQMVIVVDDESSSTMKTERTKAISPSPPKRSHRKRLTSWRSMAVD